MECSDVQRLLFEYVDGSLDREMSDKIKEHISRCDSCSKEYELNKYIIKSLHALKEEDLPYDFNEKLHRSLIQERHEKRVTQSRKYVKAAAALLVISVCLGTLINSGILGQKKSSTGMQNASAVKSSPENSVMSMDADASKGRSTTTKSADKGFTDAAILGYTDVSISLNGDEYEKYYKTIAGYIEKSGGKLGGDEQGVYLLPQSNLDGLIKTIKENCGIDSIVVTPVDISKQYEDISTEITKLEEEKKLNSGSSGSYDSDITTKKAELDRLNQKKGSTIIRINKVS